LDEIENPDDQITFLINLKELINEYNFDHNIILKENLKSENLKFRYNGEKNIMNNDKNNSSNKNVNNDLDIKSKQKIIMRDQMSFNEYLSQFDFENEFSYFKPISKDNDDKNNFNKFSYQNIINLKLNIIKLDFILKIIGIFIDIEINMYSRMIFDLRSDEDDFKSFYDNDYVFEKEIIVSVLQDFVKKLLKKYSPFLSYKLKINYKNKNILDIF
jgi:hypothetical protein